jgi:hypothetical protein
VPERHAPAPATELLPSAANACSTFGIRTRAADGASSGFGARTPGSFAGPTSSPFGPRCARAACTRKGGAVPVEAPESGTSAARVTGYPTGRLARRPPRISCPPWRARPPGGRPHRGGGHQGRFRVTGRFGAAGVNGRVPGPHSFDCGSARRRDCQALTVRLQLRQTGGRRSRRPQDRRGDGVSTKFVNPPRRERSGPTRDNSFRQGPLRQVRAQVEASPPDPHHSAVAAVLGRRGLAAPAKALPCQISAADTNRFEPRALPCQGSLQVAEALGQ